MLAHSAKLSYSLWRKLIRMPLGFIRSIQRSLSNFRWQAKAPAPHLLMSFVAQAFSPAFLAGNLDDIHLRRSSAVASEGNLLFVGGP